MKLDEYRNTIDEVDTEILKLLNRRAALSREIGIIKARAGLPVIDPHREDLVLRRVARNRRGDIAGATAVRVYREILADSRRIQIAVMAELAENEESYR